MSTTRTRAELEEAMTTTKALTDVAARHVAELAAAGDTTSTEFESHLSMYRKLNGEFTEANSEYSDLLAAR